MDAILNTSKQCQLRTVLPKLAFFFTSVCLYFILWLPEAENPTVLSAFVKCLPILCLCGFVWSQTTEGDIQTSKSYNNKIFSGLVFSSFGDIFLVWEDSLFEYGVVAFTFAHLFYVLAFGFKPLNLKLGLLLLSLVTCVYHIFLPKLEGSLVLTVAVYMFAITLMLWRALDRLFSGFTGERICIGLWPNLAASVGALLFAASDFTLGFNKFCFAFPCARAVIMVTYYGGQMGIALSTVGTEAEVNKKEKCAQAVK